MAQRIVIIINHSTVFIIIQPLYVCFYAVIFYQSFNPYVCFERPVIWNQKAYGLALKEA